MKNKLSIYIVLWVAITGILFWYASLPNKETGNQINMLGATPALTVTQGGTGTTTAPTFGQLLVGNASGKYDLLATSSLNISAAFSTTTNDVWLASKTTDNLAQGSTNLYSQWKDGGTYLYPTNAEGLLIGAASSTIYGLNNTFLDFALTASSSITMQEGRLMWNDNEGTLLLGMPGGNVFQSIGQELYVPRRCQNNTGADIANGAVVFISGSQGNNPTISLATGINEASSSKTIGLATEDIDNGQKGFVTTFGIVRDVNTNGWVDGTDLWLGTTTPGTYTNIRPVAPYHAVYIGSVIKQGTTDGEIMVNIHNGYELDELHDVYPNSPSDMSLLAYDSANGYWTKNDAFTEMKDPTGFENQTDSTYSLATSTRTFTIQPVSSSYDTYYRGRKRSYTAATSTVLSNTYGLHFIYFDSNGNIQNSTTAWDIAAADAVSIATVYWAASTSQSSVQDERHGMTMDGATHAYLHLTVSSRYQSGFSLTIDNNRATTSAGVIWDEDIQISQPQATQFEVWNRNTNGWEFTNLQNAYYRTSGGTIVYDNAGASTTVGTTNYVAYWFFATDDRSVPIKVVMGQRQDTTIANARANNTYDSLVLTGSPMANESKIIWRVIMRNVGGTPTYIESQDQRAVSTLAGGGTAIQDHGTLTGLLDDDHTQYLLVDGTRSASALTVTGTTTLAIASATEFTVSGTSYLNILGVTGNTTLANASTTNLTVATDSYLGTVKSGTWNGTAIGATYGGTGLTAFTAGSLLYASAANTWSSLASSTTGKILGIGATGFPAWQDDGFLVSANYVPTGSWDFGGASLELPNSATCNVSGTTGKVCIDTTSDQVQFYGGSATRTISYLLTPAVTIASTSLDSSTGTTTIPLGYAQTAETWSSVICGSSGGSGVGTTTLRFGDGTNYTNTITATSTAYSNTLTSNNSFTANEKREIQIQSVAGSPNYISCTIIKSITND